jgi:hypothetical protein
MVEYNDLYEFMCPDCGKPRDRRDAHIADWRDRTICVWCHIKYMKKYEENYNLLHPKENNNGINSKEVR